MRATARQTAEAFTHRIQIREHQLLVDEPPDQGGNDAGPTPQELLAASLASCTAITLEMYANRKGWDFGPVEVEWEYTTPERCAPTQFKLTLRLGADCSDEQLERLEWIAARCPVHRTLAGEVAFEQQVERPPA